MRACCTHIFDEQKNGEFFCACCIHFLYTKEMVIFLCVLHAFSLYQRNGENILYA